MEGRARRSRPRDTRGGHACGDRRSARHPVGHAGGSRTRRVKWAGDAMMDLDLNPDSNQMAFDDAIEAVHKQLTACTEGIARLEARPPVDLEMLERGMDLLTKALPPRQAPPAP